jgi:hypothetical protein
VPDDTTSTARRLHDVLKAIEKEWSKSPRISGWDPLKRAHEVLQLELGRPSTTPELMAFYAELSAAPKEIIEELRTDGARELAWMEKVLRRLSDALGPALVQTNLEKHRAKWLNGETYTTLMAADTPCERRAGPTRKSRWTPCGCSSG